MLCARVTLSNTSPVDFYIVILFGTSEISSLLSQNFLKTKKKILACSNKCGNITTISKNI